MKTPSLAVFITNLILERDSVQCAGLLARPKLKGSIFLSEELLQK
jgi:hypothetical protein